ncbi:unnamed protein product [Moneuplotes crassus]|uniref:Uncharacterized protein n=1 Tax=Euplotes crassus TaxID=5936 RepID=A0AAD1X5Y4_EUPCR|nr:unnamed protein product [Moneuplotes crassus]
MIIIYKNIDFPSKVEYPHNLVFFQNVCKLLEKEYEEVKIDETTYFIFPTLFDIKPPPKLLSDSDSIYACNSRKYIDFTKEMETNFVVLKSNAFKTCKFMELFDQVVEKGKLTEFLTNLAESHLKFSLASDDFDRDKHIIIRLAGVLESHMKNSDDINLKLPKVLLRCEILCDDHDPLESSKIMQSMIDYYEILSEKGLEVKINLRMPENTNLSALDTFNHSNISLSDNIQHGESKLKGDYCFIGTQVKLMKLTSFSLVYFDEFQFNKSYLIFLLEKSQCEGGAVEETKISDTESTELLDNYMKILVPFGAMKFLRCKFSLIENSDFVSLIQGLPELGIEITANDLEKQSTYEKLESINKSTRVRITIVRDPPSEEKQEGEQEDETEAEQIDELQGIPQNEERKEQCLSLNALEVLNLKRLVFDYTINQERSISSLISLLENQTRIDYVELYIEMPRVENSESMFEALLKALSHSCYSKIDITVGETTDKMTEMAKEFVKRNITADITIRFVECESNSYTIQPPESSSSSSSSSIDLVFRGIYIVDWFQEQQKRLR